MSRVCPVDHEAVEERAGRLPRPLRKAAYLSLGVASVVMGVIGIVVPVWPTTCFLLLAGWCFARSSPRAEEWLYRNRLFGRYLSAYRLHGVVSTRVRGISLAVLWVSIAASIYFVFDHLWLVAFLAVLAGVISVHLLSLSTQRRTE